MAAHRIRRSFTSDHAADVVGTLDVGLVSETIKVEEMERRSESRAADEDILSSHLWLRFEHQFDGVEERRVMAAEGG
jgi:hypothetical protein